MRRTLKRLISAVAFVIILGAGGIFAADIEPGMAAYDAGDYATALKEFLPLAEQGHANSQHRLGNIYQKGLGVKQDIQQAIKWYKRAAEKDYVDSIYNLSLIYSRGEGVAVDMEESAKWTTKAAALGDAESIYGLSWFHFYGRGLPKDLHKAEQYLREAVKLNYPDACYLLTRLYSKNPEFVNDEAIQWLRRDAESDNPTAQFCLELLILKDKRFAVEHEETGKWIEKAALHGLAPAQERLGIMYYHGDGVAKDVGEAVKWLNAATEGGLDDSPMILADIHLKGLNGAVNAQEGYRLMKISAERDNVIAQLALSIMCFFGKGTDKDPVQAYKWFLLADQKREQLKNTPGETKTYHDISLPDFTKRMSPQQIAEAERLAAEWRPERKKK
ncbi:MAG: hypothetical protein A3G18_10315 [Rhodospirillales bacterium RIFCSPLOWO2_12_FULL_58_28]|nr:MAG: hypothetical protein A3H92_08490 [Rhodospirillales bacterium RIFCSPLOWO2_02_FULL_58_16]OHC77672.1 MAG: hypothetical protein A3G18_10315 [Rhodospirillales bacterium RIFCSPLOWO2_12_FULL_58_28]